MLAHLCDEADGRMVRRLRGQIIPTKKNEPVHDRYARHGFVRVDSEGVSGETWELDLEQGRVDCPEWVTVVTSTGQRET